MKERRFLRAPSPAIVIAVLALVLGLGGVAYGATGGNFILGVTSNTATSETKLSSNAGTQTLTVQNTAGRPAARFNGGLAVAPFSVNSGNKVTSLNADRLDGLDSTGFITAGPCSPVSSCKGSNAGGAIGILPGASGTLSFGAGLFSLTYACPSDLTQDGVMTFTNTSAATENVFANSGGDNPNYTQLAASGTAPLPATAAGDTFEWQIQHPTAGLATIHAATVNRLSGSDCHFQAQVVITRP